MFWRLLVIGRQVGWWGWVGPVTAWQTTSCSLSDSFCQCPVNASPGQADVIRARRHVQVCISDPPICICVHTLSILRQCHHHGDLYTLFKLNRPVHGHVGNIYLTFYHIYRERLEGKRVAVLIMQWPIKYRSIALAQPQPQHCGLWMGGIPRLCLPPARNYTLHGCVSARPVYPALLSIKSKLDLLPGEFHVIAAYSTHHFHELIPGVGARPSSQTTHAVAVNKSNLDVSCRYGEARGQCLVNGGTLNAVHWEIIGWNRLSPTGSEG